MNGRGSSRLEVRPRFEPLEPRLLLDGLTAQQAVELFNISPALFVANEGQWADGTVRFVHNGSGVNVAMTDAGPVFQLFRQELKEGQTDPLDDPLGPDRLDPDAYETYALQFSASFVGAEAVQPVGLSPSETVFNYCIGDRDTWREAVPSYEVVAYEGLYGGIDLHTWGLRSHLKYEFHVAPGGDWSAIQVRYDGIAGLSIDEAGQLIVDLGGDWGQVVDDAPYIYQDIDGERVEVAGRFVLLDEWTYSFEITGPYAPAQPLVIDPNLVWATYLGGSGGDDSYGIAVDASGNAYVTGETYCSTFTGGSNDGGTNNTYKGNYDAFVAKLTSSGTLAWATYLGGSSGDAGYGIAVDASGNAYVTGRATSSNFTGGSNDHETSNNYKGVGDAFVAKLTSSGELAWATYLGGSSYDWGYGIAVDASGNAYVTGRAASSNFTGGSNDGGTNNSYKGGDYDAFVAKLTSSGTLAWATYLGGSSADYGYGIAVDASGNAYVTGKAGSSPFTGGANDGGTNNSYKGGGDAFVAKLTSSGTLDWATYLGGSSWDYARGIAMDASGNAYVAGDTASSNFTGGPNNGGTNNSYKGAYDAFVAKIGAGGVGPEIDLDPLWLSASGGFTYNEALDRYEASGVVQVGLTDGTNDSQALLSVDGSVWYDESTIHADGTVSAEIGGISAPLFTGMFEFDVGAALTSALNDSLSNVEGEYEIGGVHLDVTRVELVDPTGGLPDDAQLEIEAALHMPAELGGATVAVQSPNKIVIDAAGVSITGGVVSFPDMEFDLLGLLRVKAKHLEITYSAAPEFLRIQGWVNLPDVFNVTADFAGDNYIKISPAGVEVVGRLSAEKIAIVPGVWEIKSAALTIDTVNDEVRGDATILIPGGVEIQGGVGFVGGELNYLSLGAPGPLNKAIGTTGVFLQDIWGSVDHLADPDPVTFAGDVGVTAGPQISIDMPWWWPGGDFEGWLLRLDVNGLIDRNHLEANGTLSIVSGLATVEVDAVLNWQQGYLQVDGTMNVLDGFIVADAHLRADSRINISLHGGAAVAIPQGVPFFGGIPLASGSFLLDFTNDGNYANDFIAAWGEQSFWGVYGLRLYFNGHWDFIDANAKEQLSQPQQGTLAAGMPGAEQTAPGEFEIDPGTNWAALSAEWENSASGVEIFLVAPGDVVLTEADIAADPNITIVTELCTDRRRVVRIESPEAGTWGIGVVDATGLGEVSYYGMVGVGAPMVSITGVAGGEEREPVTIDMEAFDADSDAVVSLYYDDDGSGFDGVRIAGGLVETDGDLTYEWDTSGMMGGTYYVYAMIDDGDSAPAFVYAPEAVTITSDTEVVDRRVFYNNSWFDDEDAGRGDDDAIATDKVALRPDDTATFANYTSYSKGINGVMVDIDGLLFPADITAGDFEFRVGNTYDPAGWDALTVPVDVSVRHEAGAGMSDRITLIFPDGAVAKTWLQVTVLATMNTGLAEPDVFYFGNAIGESGSEEGSTAVDSGDRLGARANPRGAFNPAPIDFAYDYNRDRMVDSGDRLIARANATSAFTCLKLITAPPAVPPPAGAGEQAGQLDGAEAADDRLRSQVSALEIRVEGKLPVHATGAQPTAAEPNVHAVELPVTRLGGLPSPARQVDVLGGRTVELPTSMGSLAAGANLDSEDILKVLAVPSLELPLAR